jgi:phosphoserine phosphatase RsbU/P
MRLETGGPVVGLFGPAKYVEGSVQLESGDLLVGFTDGISEAMNEAEEEWGEEALADYVKARRGEGVKELIPEIMAGADAFAAGAPQHDDMTLVVLRVRD